MLLILHHIGPASHAFCKCLLKISLCKFLFTIFFAKRGKKRICAKQILQSLPNVSFSVCIVLRDYACLGASTGQTLAQVPQSTQTLSSITYLPSPSLMQETGHSEAQAPQLMQSSLILYAMIHTSLILYSF
jgi:hypothetical protein